MIAGTAFARGFILITANTREFSRVPGLAAENWRFPPTEVRENPESIASLDCLHCGCSKRRRATTVSEVVQVASSRVFLTSTLLPNRPIRGGIRAESIKERKGCTARLHADRDSFVRMAPAPATGAMPNVPVDYPPASLPVDFRQALPTVQTRHFFALNRQCANTRTLPPIGQLIPVPFNPQ